MKFKVILFMILTFSIFSQGEGSIKNAAKLFEAQPNYWTYVVRTAKQLKQPDEIVATTKYNNKWFSGYTQRIKNGDEYLVRATLFKGFEYIIIAAGDDNALDIDLFVYDGEGNTVAMDRRVNNVSHAKLTPELAKVNSINNAIDVMDTEVSIRPLETEKFWIKIKLRDSLTSTNDVGVIIGSRAVKN